MSARNQQTGPAYRIHTSRLLLRCWDPADAPLLDEAIKASIDHLLPWMPWAAAEPKSIEARIALLRQFRAKFDLDQDYVYGVFNRAGTAVIGGTGLHTRTGHGGREIGYWIHKDHINRGLATELTAALTRVAFEIDLVERVEIHMDPTNHPSAAVPRKLGFLNLAILPKWLPQADGSWRDEMVWALYRSDFPQSPAAKVAIEAFDAAGTRIL